MTVFYKILKFILKLIGFLFILVLVGLVGLNYVDMNPYKNEIVKAIEQTTGVKVAIEGRIDLKILPFPRIQLEKVSTKVGVPENKFRLQAENLDLKYNIEMLWKSMIVVDHFDLHKIKLTSLKDEKEFYEFENLTGELKYSDGDFFVDDLTAKHKLGTFKGNIKFINALRPTLIANLSSDKVVIPNKKQQAKKGKLFLDTVIPLKWMSDFKGDLKFDIKHFEVGQHIFKDSKFDIDLIKDQLNISQTGKTAQGNLNGSIKVVKLATDNPVADVDIKLKNANAEKFLKQINSDLNISGGTADFEFKGKGPAKSIAQFMANLNGDLKVDLRKVNMQGKVEDAFKFDGFLVKSFTYDGDVVASSKLSKNQKSNFKANLNSNKISLSSNKVKTAPGKTFSNKAISTKWLNDLEAEIKLKAKTFIYDQLKLSNAIFDISLMKDSLRILQSGIMSQGSTKSSFELNQISSRNPTAKVAVNIQNANAGQLIQQVYPEIKAQGGQANFQFSGQGQAKSVGGFMASLTGDSQLFLRKVSMQPSQVKSLSVGGAMLNLLSLSKKSKRQEVLECAVIKFKIRNGIARANNSIGFETSSLMGLGKGEVNLKTEAIQFTVNLEPKKNLPFSIGEFDNLVAIGGTIQKPQIQFNTMGAVEEGISLLFGIPTMGLSIVAKSLKDMIEVGGSPCERAMSSN